MSDVLGCDLMSELCDGIIETILIELPIIDATRTTILSSKWKNKWCFISHLVFDENSFPISVNDDISVNYDDILDLQERIVKFISKVFSLHKGPIQKFEITQRSLSLLDLQPEINDWILFVAKNGGVKDITLDLGIHIFFIIPSSLFDCKKLIKLELSHCELYPPDSFKGFSCLKSLILHQVLISGEAIESLISSCPLLESLSLLYFDCFALTVCAPNLKYLCLEGEFTEICLVDTPLLVELSVDMYMPDDVAEHMEQSSTCNFVKFLGGVPNLERLVGLMDFMMYLSIGNDLGHLAITYNYLETIEMGQVRFEDKKEILVVLRLITSSPNLKELRIWRSSNISAGTYAAGMEFWEKECPSDFVLSQLKLVKLTQMSGVPHDIEFIKFLLGCSPVLETMSITPSMYDMECQLKKFRRASTKAEVNFSGRA